MTLSSMAMKTMPSMLDLNFYFSHATTCIKSGEALGTQSTQSACMTFKLNASTSAPSRCLSTTRVRTSSLTSTEKTQSAVLRICGISRSMRNPQTSSRPTFRKMNCRTSHSCYKSALKKCTSTSSIRILCPLQVAGTNSRLERIPRLDSNSQASKS